MSARPIEIHVIADSTGDTAARVARAAQAQFARHPTRIVRHPRVMTAAGLATAFERIADGRETGVAVFSTLVDDGLRALVVQRCEQLRIPHCDLLGPALETMERASGDRAERIPARPVGIDSDYFKRIAAMEFVVKHDDGQYLDGLRKADIVLVGVSRTGKTPLSMYLGYLGYRTANVPLVPGIPPPPTLFEIDRWKIIALTIDPQRLARIRTRRVKAIGSAGDAGGYSALAAIFDELDQAAAIQRRLGCPVIDTTNLALEEAAGRIIDLVDDRRPGTGPPAVSSSPAGTAPAASSPSVSSPSVPSPSVPSPAAPSPVVPLPQGEPTTAVVDPAVAESAPTIPTSQPNRGSSA